jgi:hypothetical protein
MKGKVGVKQETLILNCPTKQYYFNYLYKSATAPYLNVGYQHTETTKMDDEFL